MTFIEIAILFYFLALIAFFIYGAHRHILDKLFYRLPPGPTAFPFIGTAYLISGDSKKNPGKALKELSEIYGLIYRFYFGQLRMIVLNGPKAIREMIVLRANQFSYRPDSFMPGYENSNLNHGLIASDGDLWLNLRRFCSKGLRNFGPSSPAMLLKVQEESVSLVQQIGEDNQTTSSFSTLVTNAVSNVLFCLVFGHRVDIDDPNFLDFCDLRQSFETFFQRQFKENTIYFAVPFVTKFDIPPQVDDLVKIDGIVRRMLSEAIEERRQNFNSENNKVPRDFVDLYILGQQENDHVTFESYVAAMRDMFVAGIETTSAALTWTIFYMCKWPEVQRRCQDEIDQIVGVNRLANMDDRPRLIYIDAVMCEILRHVTIAPVAFFHATKHEFTDIEGYKIPPNTIIGYNIWSLHHDVDYWKDPETFRPERWIDRSDDSLLTHESHFMPFGTGPRACLGEQLARLQYFIFIVSLLQRFNFSFPSEDYCEADLETGSHNLTHVPPKFQVVIQKRRHQIV